MVQGAVATVHTLHLWRKNATHLQKYLFRRRMRGMNKHNLTRRKERIARAKRFTKMRNTMTVKEIAKAEGVTHQMVYHVLKVLK